MSESNPSREHYRLRYPVPARPHLTIELTGGRPQAFAVTELAEAGCRIVWEQANRECFADAAKVIFCFHDGTRIESHATQLRVESEEMVLSLSPGIPLKVIMSEQRRVLKDFPRAGQS